MSTAVLDTDFDTDHPEYPAPVTAPTAIIPPAADVPSPTSDETAAQKRAKLMASGSFYRDSTPHQAAAQTWAIVELVEATDKQTAALTEQNRLLAERNDLVAAANDIAVAANEIAAQQVAAAVALAEESRVQTILSIYSTNPMLFPEGVLDQLKAFAGLIGSDAVAAEPAATAPEPAADPEIDFS